MDTTDLVSESWCSVHYPVEEPVKQPVPALNRTKDQRVAAWLQTLPVCYEPVAAPSRALHAVELSAERRHRSLSDASLADFLRCRGVHRPSFMDQHKEPRRADLSASDPTVSTRQNRQSKVRRPVGWTATRVDTSAVHGSVVHNTAVHGKADTAYDPEHIHLTRQSTAAPHAKPKAAEGGAEFLGQALADFVAFQPLDFGLRSPEVVHGPSLVNIASAGLANIRTYLSSMFDEFAHSDTIFIQ
ncbi:hypothetical protein GGH19_004976 [Coemansia sp. RSA 1807]|nr:hypothetical protein LPJ58_003327 [Coemansia sp. RSA 1591]KAJ1775417.1 hypothetical protein LPJ54_003708 [Coemansia sp. RSA 1824]KAJ1787441.1 hypothetical protein LPJ67_003202 [Coemansia sp. RSA 1938]KAJ2165966.1 hypothetical protein GGH15_003048 [Coemansia sp. RSA 562]KAJ2187399.1 hypothetical protein EV181_002778 [Coemansia sp. RSA 532]KAJ2192505.1 hypothetical protein GGH18_002867 [Coemansia sp. RSA 530]KAJ2223297.1 hypothetical protein IW143_001067 [Coemansia sp. RSA 520]KAJ2273567.1 